jgi:peptidoglycan-N-acetylglucosamine deacetylase
MKEIHMWKNKYHKAVTFSFDDGITQDIRLVQLLNKYHLKGTFNINTGLAKRGLTFPIDHVTVDHLNLHECIDLYQGHEVAIHSVTHPDLTKLSNVDINDELSEDRLVIQKTFGYTPVGMAYPYGTFNDHVVDVIKSLGIQYARTVISTYDFKIQTDLLRFKPTIHQGDPKIFELIDAFLSSDSSDDQLLYIWGHSYEFDVDQSWERFESICLKLSDIDFIYYGTNQDVLLDDSALSYTMFVK